MRLWVCILVVASQTQQPDRNWGGGGQCFAYPALLRPPVEQVRRASYVWSPETYKDIQAQFMNISHYVPELHNIVTASIAFLSQHPTPPHPSLSAVYKAIHSKHLFIKPHQSPEVPIQTVLLGLKWETGGRGCGASSSLMTSLCGASFDTHTFLCSEFEEACF